MQPKAFITPVPTQADLRDDIIAIIQARLPDWTPNDSDPGYYIADIIAARIIGFINSHNTGAAELYPLTASVEGLIQLLDGIGVENASGTITQLLNQYRERWQALAASTTEFVERLVRSFNDEITSVKVARDIPRSKALIFALKADGVALTLAERTALNDRLNDDFLVATKVIWWDYIVIPALHVSYTLTATIRYRSALISLEDIKELVENTLTETMNSLAVLNRTIGQSIVEQALYDLNTEVLPLITFASVVLTPTIGDNPDEWHVDPEPLGLRQPTTLYVHGTTLSAVITAIRRDNDQNQPTRFVTNQFTPMDGRLIQIKRGTQWSVTGRIQGTRDTTRANEVGKWFEVDNAVSTGFYTASTIDGGEYSLGPLPHYTLDLSANGHYMPSDLGVVYGPGTFDPDVDLTYVADDA